MGKPTTERSANDKNPNVKKIYPLSVALPATPVLAPVLTGTADHAGFDEIEVKAVLGATRFNNLLGGITRMFSCGHRIYPATHASMPNCEVRCIYAADLEAFLKAGG